MLLYHAGLIVAAEAARPVEDGVGAVGVAAHFDPGLDEMRPQRALRDLQFEPVERHAIVVADLTLFLNAQNLGQIDAGNGDEGRAFLARADAKAGIVGLDVDVLEEAVGRFGGRRRLHGGRSLPRLDLQRGLGRLRARRAR